MSTTSATSVWTQQAEEFLRNAPCADGNERKFYFDVFTILQHLMHAEFDELNQNYSKHRREVILAPMLSCYLNGFGRDFCRALFIPTLCFSKSQGREQLVCDLFDQAAGITFSPSLAKIVTHSNGTTTHWVDFVQSMKVSTLSHAKKAQTKYMEYMRLLALPPSFHDAKCKKRMDEGRSLEDIVRLHLTISFMAARRDMPSMTSYARAAIFACDRQKTVESIERAFAHARNKPLIECDDRTLVRWQNHTKAFAHDYIRKYRCYYHAFHASTSFTANELYEQLACQLRKPPLFASLVNELEELVFFQLRIAFLAEKNPNFSQVRTMVKNRILQLIYRPYETPDEGILLHVLDYSRNHHSVKNKRKWGSFIDGFIADMAKTNEHDVRDADANANPNTDSSIDGRVLG